MPCLMLMAACASEHDANIELRVEEYLSQMTLEEKVGILHAQSKFSSAGVPRLGIPELWTTDGPHGIRAEVKWDEWNQAGWTNDSCTAFPALTCLAATWSEEMSALYGRVIGEEARYREKDVLLGPGVNIYRTPLCGFRVYGRGSVSGINNGRSIYPRGPEERRGSLCKALCSE